MILSVLLILASFLILALGAEGLVRGGAAVGLRFGLNPLVVGLTIVAFGTSAPELAVSIKAALSGAGDIAVGNVVGSNLFNVAVILGLAALVRPLSVQTRVVRLEMPLMLGASLLFVFLLGAGKGLARWEAGLLFAGIVAYTIHQLRAARHEPDPGIGDSAIDALAVPKKPVALWLALAMVGGGLLLLVGGARVLVDNAVDLARALGVAEAVIGLTIIATGTSLPELATSVVASIRGETDIAIGNIVGSNIFNVLCVAGAAGVIAPIAAEGIRATDLAWMLCVSALLLPLMRTGFKLQRWEGAVLLVSYAVYLVLLWPE
jgi:cation:H+ antiporter